MTGQETGNGPSAPRPDEGQRPAVPGQPANHGSAATTPAEALRPVPTSDDGAGAGIFAPTATGRRRTLGAVVARVALVVVGTLVGFVLATLIGLVTGFIPLC